MREAKSTESGLAPAQCAAICFTASGRYLATGICSQRPYVRLRHAHQLLKARNSELLNLLQLQFASPLTAIAPPRIFERSGGCMALISAIDERERDR